MFLNSCDIWFIFDWWFYYCYYDLYISLFLKTEKYNENWTRISNNYVSGWFRHVNITHTREEIYFQDFKLRFFRISYQKFNGSISLANLKEVSKIIACFLDVKWKSLKQKKKWWNNRRCKIIKFIHYIDFISRLMNRDQIWT
jgi:hypothetical protein